MRSVGRRQVKSPVGHTTKRGAELETTPKTPRLYDTSPRQSTGESKGFSALSPICLNAIPGGFDQAKGQRGFPRKLPWSPGIEDPAGVGRKTIPVGNNKEQAHGGSPDGLCPSSSSEHSLSRGKVLLWSNPAFSQASSNAGEAGQQSSKNAGSYSPCTSSTPKSSRSVGHEEHADCHHASNKLGLECCTSNPSQLHDGQSSISVKMLKACVDDLEMESSPSDMGRKLQKLKENGKTRRKVLFEEWDGEQGGAVFPIMCHSLPGEEEEKVQAELQPEIGLDEIDQEIQRLTERLTELRMQKRKREDEMKRRQQDILCKKVDREEKVPREVQQTPARRSLKCIEESSSPLVSVSKRMHLAVGSVSKLSELRRSVSCTGSRRTEESNHHHRTSNADAKVLKRRQSLGGDAATLDGSQQRLQGKQVTSSSSRVAGLPALSCRTTSKVGGGTPSSCRVVSSRYGRATTADAVSGGPSLTASSKKRDRPAFSSASSSPLPHHDGQRRSVALTRSPLMKAATPRCGYPSRWGFSTPTKLEQQRVSSTTPAVLPTTVAGGVHNKAGLHLCSSPCKSPKSTAALYKCLESLLEDSKHFFKRMSPAQQAHPRPLSVHRTSMIDAAGANRQGDLQPTSTTTPPSTRAR